MAFFKSKLIKHVRRTLDLVYPINCLVCGDTIDTAINNGIYCSNCRPALLLTERVICPFCNAFLPDKRLILDTGCYCCVNTDSPLKGIVTIGKYHEDELLGKQILSMKHGGKTWFSREFGTQLGMRFDTLDLDVEIDAVVSVPLHYSRKWKRGYNQASLIAGFLADQLDLRCYDWMLKRVRFTKPQSGGRLKRQQNVKMAFAPGGICKNANLILVDDVVTTGATVREAARVLYKAGAASVFVAACAWVPLGFPSRNKGIAKKTEI